MEKCEQTLFLVVEVGGGRGALLGHILLMPVIYYDLPQMLAFP